MAGSVQWSQSGRESACRLHAMILGVSGLMLCLSLVPPVLAQPPASPVMTVPVDKRMVPLTITLVGSVEPNTRSVIASELAGLVDELAVDEGDWIDRGTVLCRLRNTTHRLAFEQAQAQLAQYEAELAELEAGTRKEDLDRARAEMEEAKTIHEKWERELERVQGLREQSSASLKEYNDTRADTAAARQRYLQAVARHELAEAGPRKETIARARFVVEAQRVLLARLKYDLDQTVIRAPFAGHVVRKHVEVGQSVSVGGPVVDLIDLETVLVRVDVPESAIGAAKVGEPVSVVIDALRRTFHGEIKHVIPQADEKARTFPVEIALENKEHLLKAGMFVRARMPAGPTEESLVVPLDAVLQRGGTDLVVAVIESEMAGGVTGIPMPVRLGAEVRDESGGRFQAWIAISSPTLQPGMPVAVKGHDRIYGPMPVTVVPAPEGTDTGETPTTRNAS